jgi:hypothetical protein
LISWELGCVPCNDELEQSNYFPAFFIYRLVASYRTTVGFGDAGPNEEQDLVRWFKAQDLMFTFCIEITVILQVQQRHAAADHAYQELIKKQRQKSYQSN